MNAPLEERVLEALERAPATYDSLRAALGAQSAQLDEALRRLEASKQIRRDRGRFHLFGSEIPQSQPAQAVKGEEPMPTKLKHCNKCETDKPLSEYGKNSSRPDGLQTYCKQCMATYTHSTRPASTAAPAPKRPPLVVAAKRRAAAPVASPPPPAHLEAAPLSATGELMILHFTDGVRIGPISRSASGIVEMRHHVDLSDEQLRDLVAGRSRAKAA